ncbi:MAG: helix-turn-helix domain-containing protein [Thermoproteales archaeon]|nr:helix-turn-helix domain-containing protein [Thermoproteales archaeon]
MLERIFGKSLRILVIELFLCNPDSLFNLSEIARRLGKNPGSIYRILPYLVEYGIIEEVNVSHSRKAYRLKKDSPIVAELSNFYKKISKLLASSP